MEGQSGNEASDENGEMANSATNSISSLVPSDENTNEYSTDSTKVLCKLNELKCPYTWKECNTKFDDITWVNFLNKKLSKPKYNDWKLYICKVFLGCIYGHIKEEEKALETLESCEKNVNEKGNKLFFKEIVDGMHHVISASKCHCYFQNGKSEKANDIVSTMKPFQDLSKQSKAAILATEAFILYNFGYDGKARALECAKMAIKLDPDKDRKRKGAWYYFAGKILGQLRRSRSSEELPSQEEIKMLEMSVKKSTFPVHLVVLADLYREAAKLHLKKTQQIEMADKLCQAAQDMYKKAIKDKELSVGLLRRSGLGLMKLPEKFRDLNLGEEALKMAMQIEPENPHVLKALGNLEEWHRNNPRAALNYYEQSYNNGNEVAIILVIKLRYRLDKTYDPVDDCNSAITKSKMSQDSNALSLMIIKGEYHLFVKNDILAAARELEEVIKTAPSVNPLLEYQCIFHETKQFVNIYDILRKEIMKSLLLNKYSGEDENFLNRLLKEVLDYQLHSCKRKETDMSDCPQKDETLDSAVNSINQRKLSEEHINDKSNSTKYPCKFKKFECPYTWIEINSKLDEIDWVDRLYIKLSRTNCNDWSLYSIKVLLGCIYSHQKEEKALEILDSCENLVNEKAKEFFFTEIVDGMHHVIEASICHVYSLNGKFDKASDVASNIKPFKKLSKESQAAVWATKAYILCQFGYYGKVKALKCVKMAIKLDPDDAGRRKGAWYYLMGKILAQIRRINSYNELPSKEELETLERSVKKDTFSVHLVVLADSYRDAGRIHFKKTQTRDMSNKMYQAALNMYKRAVADKEWNVGVWRRCGSGLLKLPAKYRDLNLAEETLKMAFKIAPENSDVLFCLGNLEDWYKHNPTAALRYYEKSYNCGNHLAAVNIAKIRYRLNPGYNPEDDCNKGIASLNNTLQSKMTLDRIATYMLIKGEYYQYVKNDFLAAAREWGEAIKIAPYSGKLKEYGCIFRIRRDNLNIHELLKNGIMNALESKKYSKEDAMYLESLLKLCKD